MMITKVSLRVSNCVFTRKWWIQGLKSRERITGLRVKTPAGPGAEHLVGNSGQNQPQNWNLGAETPEDNYFTYLISNSDLNWVHSDFRFAI